MQLFQTSTSFSPFHQVELSKLPPPMSTTVSDSKEKHTSQGTQTYLLAVDPSYRLIKSGVGLQYGNGESLTSDY